MNFTFGIITDGNTNLSSLLDTIKEQHIPNYEIIIVGGNKTYNDTIHIPFDETIKKAWITRKKNIITENARPGNIVYMHDYIHLCDNWYEGFLKFGEQFEVCMNPIINFDGTRYRDWTLFPTFLPSEYHSRRDLLLPYNVTNLTKYQYISGAYWIAKKEVMMQCPLDETLCWGQEEDLEWSKRVLNNYSYSINIHSTVQLSKPGKDRAFSEAQEDLISNLTSKV
jgi:hypothetical protein